MSKTPLFSQSFEPVNQVFSQQANISATCVDFLPVDYRPSEKDIICGRARENFHHGKQSRKCRSIEKDSHLKLEIEDGNRYFRDMIQQNVGPYLAARTKVEKTEAIASIVDKICRNSPSGGFIKKDTRAGRWYRIKDNEARDKVGHAIRKAVQRLEHTKPRLAARIKKEYTTGQEHREQIRSGHDSIIVSEKEPSPKASPQEIEDSRMASGILSFHRSQTIEPAGRCEGVHSALSSDGGYGVSSVGAGVNCARNQDVTNAAAASVLEQLLGQSVTGFPVPPQQRSLSSSRSSLGGLSAMAGYFSSNNVSIFPPPTCITTVDSARLVAASLLAQPSFFQHSTTISHAYNPNVGLTVNALPATSDKLWLTAAALHHQREAQKIKELEYARRLAFTALHDMSHANALSLVEAPAQRRQASGDETNKERLAK